MNNFGTKLNIVVRNCQTSKVSPKFPCCLAFFMPRKGIRMKDDLTDITIIVDRSGSMCTIAEDMEGGINEFIDDQKKVDGEATLSVVLFDTQYEVLYDSVDIQKADKVKLNPRGCTALLDSVGKAIASTGERLSKIDEGDRPGKVICLIITDGQENASKEYKKQQIEDMITKQKNDFKWEFVFLGANQDSFSEAGSIGISHGTTINYAANSVGVKNVTKSMSNQVASYRSTGNMSFSDTDREDSVKS